MTLLTQDSHKSHSTAKIKKQKKGRLGPETGAAYWSVYSISVVNKRVCAKLLKIWGWPKNQYPKKHIMTGAHRISNNV